jgi:uncharacterized membrane protein YkvI
MIFYGATFPILNAIISRELQLLSTESELIQNEKMKEIFLILLVIYASLVFLQLCIKYFQENLIGSVYGILGVFLLKNIPTVILYLGYKNSAQKE